MDEQLENGEQGEAEDSNPATKVENAFKTVNEQLAVLSARKQEFANANSKLTTFELDRKELLAEWVGLKAKAAESAGEIIKINQEEAKILQRKKRMEDFTEVLQRMANGEEPPSPPHKPQHQQSTQMSPMVSTQKEDAEVSYQETPKGHTIKRTRTTYGSQTSSVDGGEHLLDDSSIENSQSKCYMDDVNLNGFVKHGEGTSGFSDVSIKNDEYLNDVKAFFNDRVSSEWSGFKEQLKAVDELKEMRASIALKHYPKAAGVKPTCLICHQQLVPETMIAFPWGETKCTQHRFHVGCGILAKVMMKDGDKCCGPLLKKGSVCVVKKN